APHMEGIHPKIARLLYNRGIRGKENIDEFLSDSPSRTYDPFLLKGMREAVEKIKYYIARGSRICIYGDYDVDGVTAICLVFEFLQNLTDNLMWYIPVRNEEGYGINKSALDKIKQQGAELLISVDCGISAYEEIEYAKKIGLDTIVTDHHTAGDRIADCIVINPKQPGCDYPFKELCGCGVAYKLIQALQRTYGLGKKTLKTGLDLVAIATVADIVPLMDENRTLVKHGLKIVNQKRRKGLECLIKAIGLDGVICASDIAFIIGPHINAGGRVATAESSLRLLMETEAAAAETLAEKLIENNNLRKSLQHRGFELAKEHLSDKDRENLILVSGEDIHEGVAGIVAGRLKEEFCRPALIVTENRENGVLKGTGRSIDTINLYELLKTQEDKLIGFGGHKAACGFSIKKENLEAFRLGLIDEIDRMCIEQPGLLDEVIEVDDVLELADADNDFGWMLENLEPFGQKNQRPVFMIKSVYINNLKFVGREREHCRFFIRDLSGYSMECIMFNCESMFKGTDLEGKLFDFVGRINMNYRSGAYNIQFIPIDFRRSC
ncbi:MAG: single-stranded-DNA-specific exonuclease RecJ, partial [Bacillota bacterium]|nr:single-stranded-DNA-specific exonuclease RecJ [Bacillota bacterium]